MDGGFRVAPQTGTRFASNDDKLDTKIRGETLAGWKAVSPLNHTKIGVNENARTGVPDLVQVFRFE